MIVIVATILERMVWCAWGGCIGVFLGCEIALRRLPRPEKKETDDAG